MNLKNVKTKKDSYKWLYAKNEEPFIATINEYDLPAFLKPKGISRDAYRKAIKAIQLGKPVVCSGKIRKLMEDNEYRISMIYCPF